MRRSLAVLLLLWGCASVELEEDGGQVMPDAWPAPDGALDAGPPPPPTLYPSDRRHSPLTPGVVAGLRIIAGRLAGALHDDVFAKVGDAITNSTFFLNCFAEPGVDLGGRNGLQPTIDFFAAGPAAETDPYRRDSVADEGQSAASALAGPLQNEVDQIAPRYAVVMFGTNEVTGTGGAISGYAESMLDLVDILTAQGVVPILSSIPPRDDSTTVNAWVPAYNEVARGIAQGRQIPFVDFHRELLPLAGHGLQLDGIHPSYYPGGTCVFTTEGLTAGFNVRNLITIEALDRVRQVIGGAPAPDDPGAPLVGSGTVVDPYIIEGLPFTHLWDTSRSTSDAIDVYSCGTQNESGPEVFYRFTVDKPTNVRVLALDRGSVDIDLHLLLNQPTAAACLARHNQLIEANLLAGTYYFSLDSFVTSDMVEHSGEYLFVLIAR